MQKIIVLIGDTGSGKDYFLSLVDRYDEIFVVQRHISRSPREGEEPSLSSIFSCSVDEVKIWIIIMKELKWKLLWS